MEALLAEMERKRKQVDKCEVTSKKKFFKRGDLAAKQAEEYKKKEQERLAKKGLLKEKEQEEADRSEYIRSIIKTKPGKSETQTNYKDIPHSEVQKRLRERGEPIRLFGETIEETCQRLRLVEMTVKDDAKGLRNDFKAAMDRLDQAYMDQLTKESGSSSSKAHDVRITEDILTLDELTEMAKELNQGNMQLDSKVVLEFLRFVSKEWGKGLNERAPDEKMTLQGKLKSGQYEQTMAYLKPLFRKLRSVSLSRDILNALVCIVEHMMEREYVKASDKYLQMAIGNAPWPIGVTNPGIHARTGREKISTALVAHVLNDETQRKYIQALKRLMTYCQKRFPADPSKCIEYNGVN